MRNETRSEIRDQIIFIICFIAAWYVVYKMRVFSPTAFPAVGEIGESFVTAFTKNDMLSYTGHSLLLIAKGLAIGIGLAFIFSSLAVVSKHFHAIYNLIVSICDLLPGVALLPLAICWFGIGEVTIIFIVVHSIIWPMSRSIMDGFKSIPKMYVESGMNIGLRGLKLVTGVYLPAAFSSVLSGMRVGWARAWRGLISAEMIFGIASSPGIGLFINQMRTNMNNAEMYATLIVIIIIGLIVQYGILNPIENATVKKWGMTK